MIVIGERINSTRKAVKPAVVDRDTAFIQDEARKQAEAGANALEELLKALGYEDEQRADDPGLRYLRGLGTQLRREYGISQTLHEQLAAAIENEDFETAAEIRDEMRRRQRALPRQDEPGA